MSTPYLTDIWPFFGLTISTPRITLSYPTDENIAMLVALADEGIHSPEISPFASTWSLEPADVRAKSIVQFHWRTRSALSAAKWQLPFVVVVDGAVVGSQDVFADNFHATKVATTGSWLGRPHQGKGIGTEARRAILSLLFDGLDAEVAHTETIQSNHASRRVTEKLGYKSNGETIEVRGDGGTERVVRYRLDRDQWNEVPSDDITIEGLGPCLPLIGLETDD